MIQFYIRVYCNCGSSYLTEIWETSVRKAEDKAISEGMSKGHTINFVEAENTEVLRLLGLLI